MLVDCTIETPFPKFSCWSDHWPFRWPLSSKDFLKINPLLLGLSQQICSSLRPEVAYDQTSIVFSTTGWVKCRSRLPDKNGQNHNPTKKIINDKKDRIAW